MSFATPGMLSHCGLVIFNSSDLGWLPWSQSWIKNLVLPEEISEKAKMLLTDLLDTHLEGALK